jgi:nucleotide-binding universal stress UspA family protein
VFKKLICAMDFSPLSLKAAQSAADLAKALSAKLILVHVILPGAEGWQPRSAERQPAACHRKQAQGALREPRSQRGLGRRRRQPSDRARHLRPAMGRRSHRDRKSRTHWDRTSLARIRDLASRAQREGPGAGRRPRDHLTSRRAAQPGRSKPSRGDESLVFGRSLCGRT